jgi:CDP-diacylglycerol--glycerol-3-phosphate 3-phosphatidyltransferase
MRDHQAPSSARRRFAARVPRAEENPILLKQLPNALTLLRLVLAPVIAWAVWRAYAMPADAWTGWAALAALLFVVAALTDFFDGMIARALDAHSKFGRLIDPIADKALVGLPLIAISVIAARAEWPLWQAVALFTAIIVGRDVLMTLIRLTAKDGEGARVSQLAKWKTAIELVAVAIPILLAAVQSSASAFHISSEILVGWTGFLGVAALLSAYTAFQYLTAKT